MYASTKNHGFNWDENHKILSAEDEAAQANDTLLGRVIRHQYADGYAVYQIIKVNARTVRIRVCTGLGDDWVLPAWGTECAIPLETARRFLDRSDAMRRLFSNR